MLVLSDHPGIGVGDHDRWRTGLMVCWPGDRPRSGGKPADHGDAVIERRRDDGGGGVAGGGDAVRQGEGELGGGRTARRDLVDGRDENEGACNAACRAAGVPGHGVGEAVVGEGASPEVGEGAVGGRERDGGGAGGVGRVGDGEGGEGQDGRGVVGGLGRLGAGDGVGVGGGPGEGVLLGQQVGRGGRDVTADCGGIYAELILRSV